MAKKPFNPDNFFSVKIIKDIIADFEHLHNLNFQEISLNEELIKLNYEIVSKEYIDKSFKTLEEYYSFEVDEIV